MRMLLCVLLAAACALADNSENRRTKLPYIADAVGNILPPPSSGPATVGSPVNLLTPDRYEFYTFDESGELVKRLMTLEEIQAIVAAGEETEGLVTFANENQPTIAFNFSQPPYTKVHNVVTNVQNVLKAQMEAHKNKPLTQPTLDTPDVSDSWSLILPSIFGNTGVDIVPDKTSGTFTTPETETIELDRPIDDNSLSKEGTNQIFSSSSTTGHQKLEKVPVTEKIPSVFSSTEKGKVYSTTTSTTTTSTTTTPRPTTSKSTTTTTAATKPITSTTQPTTLSSKPTTIKLRTTTTTTSTTTSRPHTTTTSKPRTTTTSKPTTKIERTTAKLTTAKPSPTTKRVSVTTTNKYLDVNYTKIQTFTNAASAAENSTVQYEKVSTFIPLSTAAYVTERSTQKFTQTTKIPSATTTKRYLPSTTRAPHTTAKNHPSITTYKPSTTTVSLSSTLKDEVEKFNSTTVTTQSVSPSTTVASTEFVSIGHPSTEKSSKPTENNANDIPEIPLFDVAQSFSQIASDLENNYQPLPTTSDLLDTTKLSDLNLESKENVDIDIPADIEKSGEANNSTKFEKPAEFKTEQPKEAQKIVAVQTSTKFDKPMKTKNSTDIHNPINVDKATVIKVPDIVVTSTTTPKLNEVKSPAPQDETTNNFIKISTLEPHSQNDSKLVSKESNDKTSPQTTETNISNLEQATTNYVVMSTTTDPVLSESMHDLFSQVVNQAPQAIFEAHKSSAGQNQEITTVVPKMTVKKDFPERIEVTSQEPIKKQDDQILEVKDKNTVHKNMTTDIPKIINKIKETDKTEGKPVVHNNFVEKNRPNDTQSPEILENKQNLIKLPEITTKKADSSMQLTTIRTDIDLVRVKVNKKETIVKDNKEPIHTVTKEQSLTTTEALPKSESTKKSISSIKKTESTSSITNKIVASENNKIADIKENGKPSQELQLPKVDEFKKKIQKVNIDDKELVNDRNNSWKLISTVSPPKANETPKDKLQTEIQENTDKDIVLDVSKENQGLEVTTKDLGEDIAQFTELCNELAFRYWQTMTENIEKRRSFILSPYSITSMLAMMFMGAKGATSGEMNDILKLDDMVTFNPHFTLKNISDSIETTPSSGVIVSAFVRELFSDRSKGKILTFYKERAQHFYNGHVEEINFKLISDIIRRRTNLLVKRYSWGRIAEYMKSNTITVQPPLAAFSANIFQTDCTGSSVEGRDGEMYFVVSPNVRQRRLVPVPAVVYRSGFLAGYDPALDATAAALGNTNSVISTLFLMPGQQGNVVHAEDLEALEKRLLDSNPTTPTWNRLLRTLLPRLGLELQIPRFSHKSIFNVSRTLQKMGLKELFDPEHADLGGLNGPSKDLYLSDMVQSTTFVTCGEGVIGEQHHIEEYPDSLNGPQRRRTSRWATGWDEPRDYQRAFHDPHDVGDAMNLPLHLRPRQARLPSRNAQPARLKFDRPFLYFVRHNPSGMILYVGRYNPRLLP